MLDHELGRLLHRLLAQPDDRRVGDLAVGGEPVEHPSYLALRRAIRVEPRGRLGDVLLDPDEVALGAGEDGVGVALGVEGERELAGELLRAEPGLTVVPGVELGPQPVDVRVDRVDGPVSRWLDLAAQRRLLGQGALQLGREQGARPGELADRRLDVHARHPAQRPPSGVQGMRYGVQPAGSGSQPVAEWRELARQQRVDRGARVGDQRVPLVVAQLLQCVQPGPQLGGEDLRVHAVGRRECVQLQCVQLGQPGGRPALLVVERFGTEVCQPVVEAVVAECGGGVRMALQKLVQRAPGQPRKAVRIRRPLGGTGF